MKSCLRRITESIVGEKSRASSFSSVLLAAIPLLLLLPAAPASAALLLSQNFDGSDGGFTVDTPIAYDGPWVYSAGTGSWIQSGQAPENQHPNTSTLMSPAITLAQTGTIRLTFAHRFSFEQDNWDGGQVRISVNGGAFTAVPSAAFTQNGYNGLVVANSLSVLAGQSAFVLDSPNFATARITSSCNLGSFQSGDSIRLAFMAANDTNTRGNFQPNWEIDSLLVETLSAPIIVCPTNIIAECTGGLTPVNYTATASDENGPVLVVGIPPSSSGFRQGTTNVTCTASNAAGVSTCTFTVTVQDTSPPNVNCPGDIIQPSVNGINAVVTYIASASDACGINSLTAIPPSGSTFPVGTNTVVVTAVNSANLTNQCAFSIIVTTTNRCPFAGSLATNVNEGGTVSFFLPGSDPDANLLQYSVTQPPAHGVLVVLAQTGAATYSPSAGYCGPDSFRYRVTDGNCSSAEGTVFLAVECLTNNCPVASNLVVTVNQDSSVNYQLPASDPDGNPLQFNITQPPLHGVVVVNVNTGSGSYTPNAGYCGPDSFGYGVRDGRCTNVVSATVSITVECSNQCPTAVATLSPTVSIGCVGLSNVVIAANNTNACVVLDGTGSTDPDGDALGYSWILDGTIAVQLSSAEEVPPNASSATGSGTVTLAGSALTVNISFSGLSANWTAAHIHGPAGAGTNAAVLINLAPIATGLGTTAGTFNGVVNLTPTQVAWLRQGLLYVNVHTTARPGGEIRSQIAPLIGASVTTCLPLGAHEVCLTVNDGRCADTRCVTVEVISPCQAVGTLVAAVEGSSLSRSHQRPLIASLKAACASFERGELDAGANQLQAFQNKVRAQVAPADEALAQHLIECAQAIIDALGGA